MTQILKGCRGYDRVVNQTNYMPSCRFKGVEHFLRRVAFNLGNSPSKTEVKVISCIPVDVSDMQAMIVKLENELAGYRGPGGSKPGSGESGSEDVVELHRKVDRIEKQLDEYQRQVGKKTKGKKDKEPDEKETKSKSYRDTMNPFKTKKSKSSLSDDKSTDKETKTKKNKESMNPFKKMKSSKSSLSDDKSNKKPKTKKNKESMNPFKKKKSSKSSLSDQSTDKKKLSVPWMRKKKDTESNKNKKDKTSAKSSLTEDKSSDKETESKTKYIETKTTRTTTDEAKSSTKKSPQETESAKKRRKNNPTCSMTSLGKKTTIASATGSSSGSSSGSNSVPKHVPLCGACRASATRVVKQYSTSVAPEWQPIHPTTVEGGLSADHDDLVVDQNPNRTEVGHHLTPSIEQFTTLIETKRHPSTLTTAEGGQHPTDTEVGHQVIPSIDTKLEQFTTIIQAKRQSLHPTTEEGGQDPTNTEVDQHPSKKEVGHHSSHPTNTDVEEHVSHPTKINAQPHPSNKTVRSLQVQHHPTNTSTESRRHPCDLATCKQNIISGRLATRRERWNPSPYGEIKQSRHHSCEPCKQDKISEWLASNKEPRQQQPCDMTPCEPHMKSERNSKEPNMKSERNSKNREHNVECGRPCPLSSMGSRQQPCDLGSCHKIKRNSTHGESRKRPSDLTPSGENMESGRRISMESRRQPCDLDSCHKIKKSGRDLTSLLRQLESGQLGSSKSRTKPCNLGSCDKIKKSGRDLTCLLRQLESGQLGSSKSRTKPCDLGSCDKIKKSQRNFTNREPLQYPDDLISSVQNKKLGRLGTSMESQPCDLTSCDKINKFEHNSTNMPLRQRPSLCGLCGKTPKKTNNINLLIYNNNSLIELDTTSKKIEQLPNCPTDIKGWAHQSQMESKRHPNQIRMNNARILQAQQHPTNIKAEQHSSHRTRMDMRHPTNQVGRPSRRRKAEQDTISAEANQPHPNNAQSERHTSWNLVPDIHLYKNHSNSEFSHRKKCFRNPIYKIISKKIKKTFKRLVSYHAHPYSSAFRNCKKNLSSSRSKTSSADYVSISYLEELARKQYKPDCLTESLSTSSHFSTPVCRDEHSATPDGPTTVAGFNLCCHMVSQAVDRSSVVARRRHTNSHTLCDEFLGVDRQNLANGSKPSVDDAPTYCTYQLSNRNQRANYVSLFKLDPVRDTPRNPNDDSVSKNAKELMPTNNSRLLINDGRKLLSRKVPFKYESLRRAPGHNFARRISGSVDLSHVYIKPFHRYKKRKIKNHRLPKKRAKKKEAGRLTHIECQTTASKSMQLKPPPPAQSCDQVSPKNIKRILQSALTEIKEATPRYPQFQDACDTELHGSSPLGLAAPLRLTPHTQILTAKPQLQTYPLFVHTMGHQHNLQVTKKFIKEFHKPIAVSMQHPSSAGDNAHGDTRFSVAQLPYARPTVSIVICGAGSVRSAHVNRTTSGNCEPPRDEPLTECRQLDTIPFDCQRFPLDGTNKSRRENTDTATGDPKENTDPATGDPNGDASTTQSLSLSKKKSRQLRKIQALISKKMESMDAEVGSFCNDFLPTSSQGQLHPSKPLAPLPAGHCLLAQSKIWEVRQSGRGDRRHPSDLEHRYQEEGLLHDGDSHSHRHTDRSPSPYGTHQPQPRACRH